MTETQFAHAVLDAIARRKRMRAVYVENGQLMHVPYDGVIAQRIYSAHPERLVGVFNAKAGLDDILEALP